MSLTASNVRITESGYIFWAPLGSTGPSDYVTALDAAFLDLGYLAQGGLTKDQPIESKDITVFQNGEVIHTICRSPKTTVGFGLIEHNKEAVAKTAYPGLGISVDKKTLTYSDHDGGLQGALVIIELNANGLGERTYYPRVKLTRRDQIATTVDNEKVYNLGFTAYSQGGFVWKSFLETALAT